MNILLSLTIDGFGNAITYAHDITAKREAVTDRLGNVTVHEYDDKGNVVNWKFEGYGPGVLYRTGWKKDVSMKPGDTVTVFGWRARDGGSWAHSREVTFSGGKKLFFGPPSGTGDGGNTPAVEVK